MKRKTSFLYYLNPGNVSAAIKKYGYAYSIKNTIVIYIMIIILTVAGGFVFWLGPIEICVVAICGMAMMPRVVVNGYKNMYEQKRFSDVNIYIEQVLYSFKKTPKIITALQDAEKIIPKDSPMRDTISEAIQYILYEYSEENSLEKGLKIIERQYKCQRLKDAHALMLKTELIGGDYESSVKILLSGRTVWETETCKFQKECKNRQRMIHIALALVCTVCLFTPLMITKFAPAVNIMSSVVYKAGTVIMILVSMRTYLKADSMASVNWLRNESEMTEEEQRKLYRKVKEYDFAREKIREAPAILTDGLRKMQDQIMQNPESNEPYMNFMKEFGILEIQSAMGMLYSISSGRGGDAGLQIDEILTKNAALLSQSESVANDSRLAALYWQFLFPSIIGGGKLLVDMTLVTIAFMSMNLY